MTYCDPYATQKQLMHPRPVASLDEMEGSKPEEAISTKQNENGGPSAVVCFS